MVKQTIYITRESFLKSKIEKLESEDLFFSDCYKKAYKIISDIDKNRNKSSDEDSDDYNNIIAFLGDRGSGKTSTMMSFCNSLSNYKDVSNAYTDIDSYGHSIFDKVQFSVLDTIDPSLFTNRDSLIEIIVSNMFNKFKKSNNIELVYKHELIRQFEKIFQEIKIVNIDKKEIFRECSDDIERYTYLSAALDLKKDLKKLIALYLEHVANDNNRENSKNKFLVIPVDDLDMNLEVGRNLLEDIRKYLIQSNVILVLATNFEQLKEIVFQRFAIGLKENFRFNKDEDKYKDKSILDDKTEKYLDKLIPYNRRCFMPNVKSSVYINIKDDCLKNLNYGHKTKEDSRISLGELVEKEFKDKLGYIVATEKHKEIMIPENLRSLIQLLILLDSMKKGDIDKNLERMSNYLEEVVISRVKGRKDRDFLNDLLKSKLKDLNRKSLVYLNTKILKEFGKSDIGLTEIKDNINYIDENKTLILSNKITLGDIVTWIKLYNRIQFKDRKTQFIETFKAVYTLKLLFGYYDDIEKKTDILEECMGYDFFGKYFDITDNNNKDKIVYNINTSKIKFEEDSNIDSTDEKSKDKKNEIEIMNSIYPYIITPKFQNKNNNSKNVAYFRLIRREYNRYNNYQDIIKFNKCFFKPLGLVSFYVYQRKENKLNIINIDNYMDILDSLDIKINDRYLHGKDVIKSIYKVIFGEIDDYKENNIGRDLSYLKEETDNYKSVYEVIEKFIKDNWYIISSNFHEKEVKEIINNIKMEISPILNKPDCEEFSSKVLKNIIGYIIKNKLIIGLSLNKQMELNNIRNKLEDKVSKESSFVKEYINMLQKIIDKLENSIG